MEVKSLHKDSESNQFELCMVLQRRHLMNQPVEYLLKVREMKGNGGLKEVWISENVISKSNLGKSLLNHFKQTKVGDKGIDLYIGKRRSLSKVTKQETSSLTRVSKSNAEMKINGIARFNKGSSLKKRNKSSKNNLLVNGAVNKSRNTGGKKGDGVAVKEKENLKNGQIDMTKKGFSKGPIKRKNVIQEVISAKKSKLEKIEKVKNKTIVKKNYTKIKVERVKIEKNNLKKKCSNKNILEKNKYPQKSSSKTSNFKKNISKKQNSRKINSEKPTFNKNQSEKLFFRKNKIEIKTFPDSISKNLKENANFSTPTSSHFPLIHSPNVIQLSHLPTPPPHHHPPSSPITSLSKYTLNLHPNNHKHPTKHLNIISHKFHNTNKHNAPIYTQLERRVSIRQIEGVFHLKEINVRKFNGFVQIVIGNESLHHSTLKNALNPRAFNELITVMKNLVYDDSRLVLISGSGNVFTSGVDLTYLLTNEIDRKIAAKTMSDLLRDFTNTLISFPKPLIGVINGASMGLGVAMLPLFDLVYASDKASFYCPYTLLGQCPEACSSHTFPNVMGFAMANELLMRGRKITALEACQLGLVSQVVWPENLMNEVISRVKQMALQSAKALESTKWLMRSGVKARLVEVNEDECQVLVEHWSSVEGQKYMQAFIHSQADSM